MSNLDKRLHGETLTGGAAVKSAKGVLAQRFKCPPFSVLSARDGAWQTRKRAWMRLGLEGELPSDTLGRDVSPGGGAMPAADYSERQRGDGRGRQIKGRTAKGANTWQDLSDNPRKAESTKKIAASGANGATVSLFDPVLCELAYHWWCPEGGQVVDPFAGGSVRGIVAKMMGREYWGCDLRGEQIKANQEQAEKILGGPFAAEAGEPVAAWPTWLQGDSSVRVADAPEADFVFSCPPYGSLEKYSDDPCDLSNMPLADFKHQYRWIIKQAAERLKDNRFACFVVGDYRLKDGTYANLPGVTIGAFQRAGLRLYNEATLVTAVASMSLRAGKIFASGRKLCKGHQNILVFVKGDWKKAAKACPAL